MYLDQDSGAYGVGAGVGMLAVMAFTAHALWFDKPEIKEIKNCEADGAVLEHHDRLVFDDYVVTTSRGRSFTYDDRRDAAVTYYRLAPNC